MTKISAVYGAYSRQKQDFMHPRWSLDLYEEPNVPKGSESFSEILKSKI